VRGCDNCGLGDHPAAAHWCRCCGALLPQARPPGGSLMPLAVLALFALMLTVLTLWSR
jgi:hypothetical protein